MMRILLRRPGARLIFLSLLLFALAFGTAAAQEGGSVTYFEDDFGDGFSAQGPDARWFYFAAGPYVGNDGIESTSPKGFRWLVDGEEKFRVDNIGHRIDRKFMTIDHGGVEETVAPRQLNFGMGMFTLLDGDLPSGKALVRLSNAQNFYFDPSQGEPTPQSFVDEESQASSRLFGQGAELRVARLTVESTPVSSQE